MIFIGKTGDGKSTAINALFNIIKGIKLEDNHRFILIKEPKKAKGQAESQTDSRITDRWTSFLLYKRLFE